MPIAESLHWTLAVICNPGALVPDEAAGGCTALVAVEEEGESDEGDSDVDGGSDESPVCDEVVAKSQQLALCYQPEGSDTDVSEEEEEAAEVVEVEDGFDSGYSEGAGDQSVPPSQECADDGDDGVEVEEEEEHEPMDTAEEQAGGTILPDHLPEHLQLCGPEHHGAGIVGAMTAAFPDSDASGSDASGGGGEAGDGGSGGGGEAGGEAGGVGADDSDCEVSSGPPSSSLRRLVKGADIP